ncbi:xenotropic and polytropic retrovirus receptor 1-related [Holotrichia oblita]|uniref:Xenotropic and polytropic retrovirus receptor 1-related n=1 Tax=Holotrichia oblita TaxID=644536 RepID=A0ACB9TSA1_HOLOL|nr:xenotropic and polytropic retrovirus receptor 1-related [Holotrichia oblita]
MKFAEHLAAHITPEWRKQYINYEEMKALLYSAVEQAPSAEHVEPEVSQRYFAKFDEQFFHYCDKELTKINTFYSEKLAEATRKYANLRSEIVETPFDDDKKKKDKSRNILRKKNLPIRKTQELKLAFSEFYLSLILLQNYQNLNFTGFRKILKKHDKLLSSEVGARWRTNHVENAHFYMNKDIDRLIRETEQTVTQHIEGGDRQKAMKRLRVPPLGEKQSPWITFKVGLFSGSFTILVIAVRVFFAPFFYVHFADFWMADQLISLIPFVTDIQYIVCFYYTNNDWYKAKGNVILFKCLLCRISGYAYANYCIEKRIFLRLFIACLPPWFRFAQCLRRFRDTRETFPHLANAAKAVRDISVAPLDCSDQMLIIRMMDDDNGVINRRKKKNIKRKEENPRFMLEGESTDELDAC